MCMPLGNGRSRCSFVDSQSCISMLSENGCAYSDVARMAIKAGTS